MTDGKKKMLPKVVIGATKDEVDLENGYTLEYKLELSDGNEYPITSFKAVNGDAKAILFVYITNTQRTKFPDPDEWLTYRFANESWLEKDTDGNLKFPQNKEKQVKEKINQMHGDFVKLYGKENFSEDKGGKTKPEEGLKDTDMKYRIETNDTPSVPGSPGIRIDIYPTSGTGSRKPIAESKVEVHLILNKKVQVNLEEDGLIAYPVIPKSEWKWYHIGLAGLGILVGLAIILGIVFHRQIREWWKKRKSKKEQLEIF